MNRPTTDQLEQQVRARWTEALRDGSTVTIRLINRHDMAAERAFIEGLSPESRRFRFLDAVASPSERMIEQFTDVDCVRDVGFVAFAQPDSREQIVGVGRYSTDPDGLICECAVTVADPWQHKGLGTVLMQRLIDCARSRGIRTMFSVDLAENAAMSELARHFGFHTHVDPDDAGQVIHELQI
jgi:GNAT superfamily N-acetyltransferase